MISSWKWINKKEIISIKNINPLKINLINFWINTKEILNPCIKEINCSNHIIPNNINTDILFILYSSWDFESKKEIINKADYLKMNNKVIIWIDINKEEDLDYKIFDSYINNSNFRFIIEWISDTISKPNLISIDWLDLIKFFKNWGKFNFSTIYSKWENKLTDIIWIFNEKIDKKYETILLNLYSKSTDYSMLYIDKIVENSIYDEKINNIFTHTYNENMNNEFFIVIFFK